MSSIKNLTFLNKNSVSIFNALIEKVENSTRERGEDTDFPYGAFKNEPFMPLNVSKIFDGAENFYGYVVECYAISRTFVQNGDLMRDPEVVFGVMEIDGEKKIFPYEFRSDRIGMLATYVRLETSSIISGAKQDELTLFSNIFLRNIKEQGFLDIEPQESIRYEEGA